MCMYRKIFMFVFVSIKGNTVNVTQQFVLFPHSSLFLRAIHDTWRSDSFPFISEHSIQKCTFYVSISLVADTYFVSNFLSQ